MLLDENNWNTAVNLGTGLTDADRIEDIVSVSQLTQKILLSSPLRIDPMYDVFTSGNLIGSQFNITNTGRRTIHIKSSDGTRRGYKWQFH